MTVDQTRPADGAAGDGGEPGRLYGPEFAADPRRVYDALRAHGALAPVEISPGVPATLVIGYDAALEVMREAETFPRCSTVWEASVGPECPVLPMMMSRPNALFTNGATHARLRAVIKESLDRVDPAALRGHTEGAATTLIDGFAGAGEVDLIGGYARVLPLLVFRELFGCPPEIGDRLVRGMSGIFDGVSPEQANAMLGQAARDLVALKRESPGADVTSWMMSHPAELDDDEMAEQIVLLLGAGTEPEQNLIANGMRLLLSDDRFGGDLSGGSLPVEDALDEILWTDPPLANYNTAFPRHDLDFHGHRLPAHQPVLISYAAANTDPSRASHARTGNRAHLAFGAGPHTCPAKGHARLIASAAIEMLLDRLPDMELAVPAEELEWRPGPFHRALTALPVRFPPEAPRP